MVKSENSNKVQSGNNLSLKLSHTVKIRDSALGLFGFVSFFGGRICEGPYPRRIYSYVLWAYLPKLTFLGGLICRGAYPRRIYSYVLWSYLTRLAF